MGDLMRLRQGTAAGLFSGSLALSLGLHAALAAVMLLWVGFSQPPAPPVLTVTLVAPEPVRPGPGAAPAPAGVQTAKAAGSSAAPAVLKKPANPPPNDLKKPQQRKAPPRARPKPERAVPLVAPRPAPPPLVSAPAPPRPAALSPGPPAAAVTAPGLSTGAPGQSAGQPQDSAGSGNASRAAVGSGAGGGDGPGGGGSTAKAQRHYLKLIRSRILGKRTYPLLARQRHQEGIVRLRFTLSAAGALAQGVQVVKPSGFQLLDDQAQQCVLAAAPFPPFPRDLKRDSLTVELPIVYKLTELDT